MAKRRKGSTPGQTIGSILVGFDQQILRSTPPVQELVAKGQPLRAVSGDGTALDIVFPADPAPPAPSIPPAEDHDD